MKEIRIHGRGGHGTVVAAEVLALAAFKDGKYSQAFPAFGPERRGAPIQSFVRIDDRQIRLRSRVYNPDYLLIFDPTLLGLEETFKGLKPQGLVIVNSEKSPEELDLDGEMKVKTIPAQKIAQQFTGTSRVNMPILGAFSALTGEVSLKALEETLKERFPGEEGRKNVDALKEAYSIAKGER